MLPFPTCSNFPGRSTLAMWCGGLALLLLACAPAQATPAFARQTGSVCADCHATAYGGGANGPNLTPYGMRFKLSGYTDSNGSGPPIPVAAQLIATHTVPARGEVTSRLTEADIYLAGRLTDHIGAFVKVAADNTGGGNYKVRLAHVDLRFVAPGLQLAGRDLTLGVSVNNSPGFQDPVSALPGASTLGPPGVTGTLLNLSSPNAPANRVIGATLYGVYDSDWYGEIGTYSALSVAAQDSLGYRASGDPGKLGDTGYFRFAWMKDLKRHFFSAGVVALTTSRQRPRGVPADDITDLGYDLTYQYLGTREHIVQLSYVNVYERRDYGNRPLGPAGQLAQAHGAARDQILSASYTWRQTYGITFSHLDSNGTPDAVRFVPYAEPHTTSNLLSLYWVPFGKEGSIARYGNLKLAATWFRFSRFNGTSSNIFGAPPGAPMASADDLDAFSVSISVAF
ncbi:MAG TPA: cytochrome C [Rhodanobacteraceae bacterium]|nr:cytochrome C [Rhodanobacteraceae bacterium]